MGVMNRAVAGRLIAASVIGLYVAAIRPVHACCQLGGTACGDPFAVDCNDGVVCFPPFRSCPGCVCTATNSGHTCVAANLEPGLVPTVQVTKSTQTAGDLDLSWGATCAASSPDYAVYEGQVGVWYSHAPRSCSSGHALTMTITPSGGNRYYLVGPVTPDFTGSLGKSSSGTERPDGSTSCTADRAIAPCP